jgi:hypothetical protein
MQNSTYRPWAVSRQDDLPARLPKDGKGSVV